MYQETSLHQGLRAKAFSSEGPILNHLIQENFCMLLISEDKVARLTFLIVNTCSGPANCSYKTNKKLIQTLRVRRLSSIHIIYSYATKLMPLHFLYPYKVMIIIPLKYTNHPTPHFLTPTWSIDFGCGSSSPWYILMYA